MKNILVIGATSAISKSCIRLWAKKGYNLFLVARNKKLLSYIANDAKVRGASKVHLSSFDFTDTDKHKILFKDISAKLKKIDIAFICYGSLTDQKKSEKDMDFTRNEINLNVTSTISCLYLLASKFETWKEGTIAVVTSVAGDRGRRTNYLYGSSKSMLTTFMSGLRQRMNASNVNILTVAKIKKGLSISIGCNLKK